MRVGNALAVLAALAGCAGEDAEVSLGEPGVEALVRPDTPGNNLQFNFDRSDVVEFLDSPGGRFRIHFTRDGVNRVPPADNDASGVPDFVEQVADVYDEVLAFYEGTLGFRAPLDDGAIADNGGDDRFDVYLVDFNGVGDGAFRVDACLSSNGERCAGFMTQENDFVGYGYPSTLVANRILGSHEFFHAVQAAYDTGQGSVFGEGMAVWATEMFDPNLEDFEWFLPGYLDNTDRPIDQPLPGPVDPFSYGSAIFFKFMEERFGVDSVRLLAESVENGANGVADPYWVDSLDGVIAASGGTGFPDAFVEFAMWNLLTDDFGDPSRSYADGADYARVRVEEFATPHEDDALRVYRASSQYFGLPVGARTQMTAALVAPSSDPEATVGLRVLLAAERSDGLDVIEIEDIVAGAEAIDTSNADRFVVVVVNTAIAGDSKKPGFCAGDPAEVAACVASLSEGEGGAGGGGGEGGGGGGATEDGGGAGDDGCGCAVEGDATSPRAALFALLLAVALQRRRRRA